jgi:hypothetical protein
MQAVPFNTTRSQSPKEGRYRLMLESALGLVHFGQYQPGRRPFRPEKFSPVKKRFNPWNLVRLGQTWHNFRHISIFPSLPQPGKKTSPRWPGNKQSERQRAAAPEARAASAEDPHAHGSTRRCKSSSTQIAPYPALPRTRGPAPTSGVTAARPCCSRPDLRLRVLLDLERQRRNRHQLSASGRRARARLDTCFLLPLSLLFLMD